MQLFDNIQKELILKIKHSEESLKIAVTWFTNHELFNAVLNKLESPEYKVTLIVLNDRINNKKEGINFQKLIDSKGNFYYSDINDMVHHKFCIIDNKTVITGSYNWTYYAENRNWENIVILEDSEIVQGYIQEFEKVIQNHTKVEKVSDNQRLDIGMNNDEYLETDYTFQAKAEEQKGNDLNVAKIYTEILKLNNKQPEIQNARKAIVTKLNNQSFETCPFEIGILFKSGYTKVVPAFTPLPITVKKIGYTPTNDAISLQTIIQKYDFEYRNIHVFTLQNIKACSAGTPKIEYTLTVDKSGILTVHCLELNGYGRTRTEKTNLKGFI